ncbi:MAG: polysaccharide deacetylase family protein [Clostridia bacterium]|nr:polysaccharide deacetylase family protein [Clostridia bacterium]
MGKNGILVISLDFELFWGNIDKIPLEKFKQNLLGARLAIPYILDLLHKYNIHATWAIVGFLFFETYQDLIESLPERKPEYVNANLSPYNYLFNNLGNNEKEDPFHYAPSLIKLIKSYPHQEIASHTFSHYYSLERGQDEDCFRQDLLAVIKAAQKLDIKLKSLVFPRNQINKAYLPICKELGFKCYRGNTRSRARSWARSGQYRLGAGKAGSKSMAEKGWAYFLEIMSFFDDYCTLFGHNTYSIVDIKDHFPFDISSSRHLRPYSKKYKCLDWLKLNRIKSDLAYAAQHKEIYHLWWHPYDFGLNIEENIRFLEKIIKYFCYLQDKFGMENMNMGELADELLGI